MSQMQTIQADSTLGFADDLADEALDRCRYPAAICQNGCATVTPTLDGPRDE